jgi:hypothetical protein
MAANMNNQQQQTTAQSAEEARDLLQEIKERARKAHEDGNVFMMNVLTQLLTVASPIVVKAIARAEREERAEINKSHKELRASIRSQSASE